ncbi:hypothetical protein [Pseudomonas sp. GZD-209]|uniref:hypothetical protein n=1 Tax=Pseudomonas sp. GZD-209 TaxID=3404807 RepID=UPI003BB656FE
MSDLQLATDRPKSVNWEYNGTEMSLRFRYRGQEKVPHSVIVVLVGDESGKAKLFELTSSTYDAAVSQGKDLGQIWADMGFPGEGEFKQVAE